MRRNLAPAIALILLTAALPMLFVPTAGAATTRVLAITTASAQPLVPFSGFDGNPPKVFDIDGDGQLEIIAQNDNQFVYVFDSKTGAILFQAKTTFPSGWGARSFNGPEVSILSQDKRVHLIVANSAAVITSYVFDPLASTSLRFAFEKEWERRLTNCYSGPGMDAKPVLADLDQDGRFEILASTEELGVYALRDDGTIFWKLCIGGGNAEPGVGDVNLDGYPDVVFGSDGGVVTAINGLSGVPLWDFKALANFPLGSGSMPVAPAIGQLDGKGGPDIVVGARDSHDANDWSKDHALLLALDHNGKLLWGRQDPGGNPLTYTRTIITDAARDGTPEVYWGDWNTIGHKPPWNEADSWKPTGPAHFYRYDPQGNLVWRQALGTWWSNKDVPIADVDGDGVQEMLANGPNAIGHDGVWYLDTNTGAKEAFVDVHPWQVARAPVLADLWNTSTMQWVVEVGQNDPSAGGSGILVYDTGVPYSAAWPHVDYPVLGPVPPPPSGNFTATFTIKSPNAWWQELTVSTPRPHTIVKADVRINSVGWQGMTKSTWGAWTSSYNSPAGSKVEFRATDTNGAVALSEPFTWLDGTLSRGSVTSDTPPPTTSPTPTPTPTTTAIPSPTTTPTTTPPTTPPTPVPTTTPPTTSPSPVPTTTPAPPPPFTASFQPASGINEWWVEVKVTSAQIVQGVNASVNSGDWKPLAPTSWSTWAKSFYVARGSQVQFRATNATGAYALSESYQWLGPPPPPPADFTATFTVPSGVNNWWVEVKVTSASTVAKVEASTNGAAPVVLDKTSWSTTTWAKSYFVPSGASVKFTATDTGGRTVESAPFTWK